MMGRPRWKVKQELRLLHEEMARQERQEWKWGDHDKDCACWRCIGELQAYVMETSGRAHE